MNCPKCNDDLKPAKIKQVPIQKCTSCGGTWFERNRLDEAKDQTDQDLNWMHFDLWKHEDEFRAAKNPVNCPECSGPMIKIEYGQTGVTIDHCPNCDGVWLDKGEFKNIIQSLENEILSKDLTDYVKDAIKEAGEVVKIHSKHMEEWRDFLTLLKLMEYRLFTDNPTLAKMIVTIQKDFPIRG